MKTNRIRFYIYGKVTEKYRNKTKKKCEMTLNDLTKRVTVDLPIADFWLCKKKIWHSPTTVMTAQKNRRTEATPTSPVYG